MKTVIERGRWLLIGVLIVRVTAIDLRALALRLTRAGMARALALTLWPHSEDERARFHQRYIVAVHGKPIESWAVEQIEVISEFRRVELPSEEHRRLNDFWGRSDLRDVEAAMAPWRGHVSIVAHLALQPALTYVGGPPLVDIRLEGAGAMAAIGVSRTGQYANCGEPGGCPIVGALVEGVFDAEAIGQTTRTVIASLNGQVLARLSIDFANLE